MFFIGNIYQYLYCSGKLKTKTSQFLKILNENINDASTAKTKWYLLHKVVQ